MGLKITAPPQHDRQPKRTVALLQLQLVRFGSGLWTDGVRPYRTLKIGAMANCHPKQIV
jgi:hypothetical protein